jgi:AcrR family transcriptional regulator
MTAEVIETQGLLPPGLDLSPSRRKLYEVALELFGRSGFHAVSIRDIATALGQQPSAIYFHVASKQELLYELALIGHRSHFESLRDALMDAGSEPADQLRATVTAHVRVHLDYPSMARLTNRELGSLTAEQYAVVLGIRSQSEQITVDVIERGVRKGVFRSTDSFLDAKAIGAMGVRLPEWWSPESPRTKEQIIEHYVTNALKIVS